MTQSSLAAGLLMAALALSASAALAAPADKIDCAKLDEVLDELGAAQGISTLNDKYKLFTSADELAARCVEMAEAIKTLRKYNKECYSSLTQQVFSAILRTRSQMNEAKCKPDSAEAREVVESVKCLADNVASVREAERKTIVASQVIHEAAIADEKLRVRRACCNVLDSKRIFMEATREKCAKFEKVYSDYVDSYTSEAMSLICPEQDKLDCAKLEPLKTEGVAPKSSFFLQPMLKLVKTLDH